MMVFFEMKILCFIFIGIIINFGFGYLQIQYEVCFFDVYGDGSDIEGGLIGRIVVVGGGVGLF